MLEILVDGHECLRKVSVPVRKIDQEILDLASEMFLAMYEVNGVGLAAPQVGHNIRLVVIDVGEDPITLINPRIVRKDGEMDGDEGCLSFPKMTGKVKRYSTVEVEAYDRDGKRFIVEASDDLLARALQHEIDHLDGILFVDTARELKTIEEDEECE